MTRTLRNIIRGVGSVVDIAPAPRQVQIANPTRGRSDVEAVRGDWQRIGGDIRASTERVKAEFASDGQPQQQAT